MRRKMNKKECESFDSDGEEKVCEETVKVQLAVYLGKIDKLERKILIKTKWQKEKVGKRIHFCANEIFLELVISSTVYREIFLGKLLLS